MTPTWKDRLEPFGYLLVNLDDAIGSMLRAMSDADLAALADATHRVTTTNCWCYVWDAAPFVRRAVVSEQGRRKVLFMDEPAEDPS